MYQYRSRVLVLSTLEDAEREITRIGTASKCARYLAAATHLRTVRLEQVPARAARALQQECLAVGCECVVPEHVGFSGNTVGSVVVIGSLRQYDQLLQRLQDSVQGVSRIAEELRRVLTLYEASHRPSWVCRGRSVPTDKRTVVMGIINLTDDSFSGDGLGDDLSLAVQRGLALVEAGADILDVGAESTRPGSLPVPAEQELARLAPVIRELSTATGAPISVDTQKPEVARKALELGAAIVNDVRGLRAPGMAETVAEFGAGVVIMHMLGEPRTMQAAPHYEDLMAEIYDFLCRQVDKAIEAGIPECAVAVDPGFGFGKTVNHNLEILRRLRELHCLGRPVVIGTSRKSTIGKVLDRPVEDRLMGTAATCATAVANGAHVIRVHDVAEMTQVARMTDAIMWGWDENASN